MRRKLDLGASLVGTPRLLLDEPTTGLDPRSRIELWDAIGALVAGGTDVLLTTQYLDKADHLASRIVIVDHGRAVADISLRPPTLDEVFLALTGQALQEAANAAAAGHPAAWERSTWPPPHLSNRRPRWRPALSASPGGAC
jgi:ABC-type multidrug transport system ATPase subunit